MTGMFGQGTRNEAYGRIDQVAAESPVPKLSPVLETVKTEAAGQAGGPPFCLLPKSPQTLGCPSFPRFWGRVGTTKASGQNRTRHNPAGHRRERRYRRTIETEHVSQFRLSRSGASPAASSAAFEQNRPERCTLPADFRSASQCTATANEGKNAIVPRLSGSKQDREQVSPLHHRHAGRPQTAH